MRGWPPRLGTPLICRFYYRHFLWVKEQMTAAFGKSFPSMLLNKLAPLSLPRFTPPSNKANKTLRLPESVAHRLRNNASAGGRRVTHLLFALNVGCKNGTMMTLLSCFYAGDSLHGTITINI